MVDLKITGPGDALDIWRRADAADDMETMQLVEDVVYLKLDPADIARLKAGPENPERYREEGFESKEAFIAEVERAARSCLFVMWHNGKSRAEQETSIQ